MIIVKKKYKHGILNQEPIKRNFELLKDKKQLKFNKDLCQMEYQNSLLSKEIVLRIL